MGQSEDPAERTKRMLFEARQEAIKHEKISRANIGKSQFPLISKLKLALPLVAAVIGIYTLSVSIFREQIKTYSEKEVKILKDAREIDLPEEEYKIPDLRKEDIMELNKFGISNLTSKHEDGEFLTDSDTKWN